MEIEEYQKEFRMMRKTLRNDIRNIFAEHGLTSLKISEIKNNLPDFGNDENDEDLLNEFEEFRQENVIAVYYDNGQTLDCYIDEICISENDICFKATDCYYDREYSMLVSYDTMELYYLYALLVDFFDKFNYNDTSKTITLKEY